MNCIEHKIDESAIISPDTHIIGNGLLIIKPFAVIEANVLIDLGKTGTVIIGNRAKLKYGCVIRSYDGKIVIGERTTICEYSILAGHGDIIIGDFVAIAGHCYIAASNHIFSSQDPIRFQGETAFGIEIQNNVWLGARSTILDGVKIGEGCVVGAGSVVTRDLKNNFVCVGVPCKEKYLRNDNSKVRS
jgi:acetyltransferase-like isoleucine patch superfamily enzyme